MTNREALRLAAHFRRVTRLAKQMAKEDGMLDADAARAIDARVTREHHQMLWRRLKA